MNTHDDEFEERMFYATLIGVALVMVAIGAAWVNHILEGLK